MPLLRVGSRGDQVRFLQDGLAYLGHHPGRADGIFGKNTEMAVVEFQSAKKVLADGIVGPTTARIYNSALCEEGESYKIFLSSPAPKPVLLPDNMLKWVRCPADVFEGRSGYGRTTLREDTAKAYMALYEEVHSLGGIITSAGGKRSIASKAGPSRSKKSMHYVGRAFDMSLSTSMRNPDTDPFICELDPDGNGRQWTVWCRTENPDVPERTVEARHVTSHKNSRGKRYTMLRSKEVVCRVFNFTEIAKKYGFERISARRSFFRGGKYGGAEWWHFQYESGMVPKETTFGEELMKLYPLDKCERFVYWDEAKDCRWKINWF